MGLGGRLELWRKGDGLLSVSVAKVDLHVLALVNLSSAAVDLSARSTRPLECTYHVVCKYEHNSYELLRTAYEAS